MRKSKTHTQKKQHFNKTTPKHHKPAKCFFFRNIVHSNDGSCTYEVYISFLPTMSMLFKVVRFV